LPRVVAQPHPIHSKTDDLVITALMLSWCRHANNSCTSFRVCHWVLMENGNCWCVIAWQWTGCRVWMLHAFTCRLL